VDNGLYGEEANTRLALGTFFKVEKDQSFKLFSTAN